MCHSLILFFSHSLSLLPLVGGVEPFLASPPHTQHLARPTTDPPLNRSLSLSLFPSVFCPFALVHHLAHRTSRSPYPSIVVLHHFIVKDIGMSEKACASSLHIVNLVAVQFSWISIKKESQSSKGMFACTSSPAKEHSLLHR